MIVLTQELWKSAQKAITRWDLKQKYHHFADNTMEYIFSNEWGSDPIVLKFVLGVSIDNQSVSVHVIDWR